MAFFWLPALLEIKYVQTEGLTSGFFSYANHFRGANLVQNSWLFDFNTASPGGRTPFAMGLVQAIFVGLGLAAGWFRVWKRRLGAWLLGVICIEFAVATLMITPLSRFLWDHLPLLPLVQFPWRFLSIQALFGAALTGQIAAIAFWPGGGSEPARSRRDRVSCRRPGTNPADPSSAPGPVTCEATALRQPRAGDPRRRARRHTLLPREAAAGSGSRRPGRA